MDIVIPLGKGSKWFDNELRYSLRSLEKFGRNVGNVFIVGELPDWLNKSGETKNLQGGWANFNNHIIHIPLKDGVGHERNIMQKFLIACKDERVSENFLMWNDDFFLTDFINCETYPNFEDGTLQGRINQRIKEDGYRKSLQNTDDFLRINNRSRLMFDIHCPIIYNKKKFVDLMDKVDWTVGNGYVVKSLYANYYDVPLRYMPDCKFSSEIGLAEIKKSLENRHIFSISDGVMMRPSKTMKIFLEESYPEKSRYEK